MCLLDVLKNCYHIQRNLFNGVIANFVRLFMPGKEHLEITPLVFQDYRFFYSHYAVSSPCRGEIYHAPILHPNLFIDPALDNQYILQDLAQKMSPGVVHSREHSAQNVVVNRDSR